MSNTDPVLLTQLSARVNRPIDDVFSFVSNHENYKLWYPGVVSVVSADDTPHGTPGKMYIETLKMPGGRHRDIPIVTIVSERPKRFVTEGEFSALMPQMTFELKPAGTGRTDLVWTFRSRHTSPVRRLVARLLYRPVMKQQALKAMAQLTRLLEENSA
ncbi:MAG: SRPBCC family protein [Henriciella sp.]|uniref:SRPBCC family protein n=1 Tax=Henriciella sp. TaxID=1968823 RepID=UPI0032EC14E0